MLIFHQYLLTISYVASTTVDLGMQQCTRHGPAVKRLMIEIGNQRHVKDKLPSAEHGPGACRGRCKEFRLSGPGTESEKLREHEF